MHGFFSWVRTRCCRVLGDGRTTAAVLLVALVFLSYAPAWRGGLLWDDDAHLTAVRRMTQMAGHRGKIVWLPTFDAENQVRFGQEDRAFVPVVRGGKPVAELDEIFKLIAQNNLVLATGQSSADESLMIIAAARQAGVKKILVTHVLAEAVHATRAHLQKMADLGAIMECTWLTHFTGAAGAINVGKPVPLVVLVRAIRDIGAEHFVLSSDFGQQGNPSHPEGMRAFMAALRKGGLDEREIDLIARQNPARLLDLPP